MTQGSTKRSLGGGRRGEKEGGREGGREGGSSIKDNATSCQLH